MEGFPHHIKARQQRQTLEVEIDEGSPWAFFDGVAQENRCGGGAILFLREVHSLKITMGLGE